MPNINIMSEEDTWRGTGRTTRLAIAFTKTVIEAAGSWIEIRDHWPTPKAARELTKRVSDILNILCVDHELQDMRIKVHPMKEKKQ